MPVPSKQLRLTRKHFKAAAVALPILLFCLAACTKKTEPVEDIRPVRALTLSAADDAANRTLVEFPGEVRARVTSKLGFRVGGKIIERKVDVGSVVKRGQVLMRLDPQDLRLAQQQTDAALQSALSSRELAQAEMTRYRSLRDKNFVSQATLDAKLSTLQTAQAGYDQAQAAARNQHNQTGYAVLVADVDGVVTSVDAEAGQVVAAGTPVVSVAQNGPMDVVIGLPEDKVDSLRNMATVTASASATASTPSAAATGVQVPVQVRLWSDPQRRLSGKIREVSPIADPATRTYSVKVALNDAPSTVKLGMTAYVGFGVAGAQGVIRVPLTALMPADGGRSSAVWVVEHNAVRQVPVTVVGETGNDILVGSGLARGQTIVTAGVNLLSPGQKVTILGAEPIVATTSGGSAGSASSPAASGGPAK